MTHVVCTTPHWQLNHKSVRFQASLPWGEASSALLNHGGEVSVANTKALSERSEHLAIPDSGRLTLILASKQSPKNTAFEIFPNYCERSPSLSHCQETQDKGRNRHLRWLSTFTHEILSVCGTKCLEIKYWTAGRTSVQTGFTQARLLSYQNVVGQNHHPVP